MTDRHVGRVPTQYSRPNVFRVKNEGEQQIPAFGCVQVLGAPLEGIVPVGRPTSTKGIFFVAGPRAINAGKHSEMFLWDRPRKVLLAEPYFATTQVGPVPGQFYMSAASAGFCVVHPSSGVGGQPGLVMQSQIIPDVTGILQSPLHAATDFSTAPGTSAMLVYEKDFNGNLVPTGRILSVVNRLRRVSGAAGDIAYVRWMDGEWRVVGLDCPS
jgi:hypothetical protein